MKCGDQRAHKDGALPEVYEEILLKDHKHALEMSTGKVQTRRWACSCGWARYEVDVPAPAEDPEEAETQLGFRFGTPGCAAGNGYECAVEPGCTCGTVKCGRCQ